MGFGEFIKSATGGGIASGLLNGVFGLIGQGQQHRNAMKQMDKQQEHALAQMAQSQEYNLANMEQQNQYQIEAEQRANEWNSIGAQVDRARAAGVSPLAAIGAGGAGGMMSVSSAPSGGAPSPAGASAVGSIGAGSLGLNLGANALQDAQIERERAQAGLARSQTVAQDIQNQIDELTKANKINIARLNEKGISIDVQQKEFEYNLSQIAAPLDLEQKQAHILKCYAEINKIRQDTVTDKEVGESIVKLNESQVVLNALRGDTEVANAELARQEVRNRGAELLLTCSQTELNQLNASLVQQNIISQAQANEIQAFRNQFEKDHAEADWKRKRTNEAIQTWTKGFANVAGGVADIVGLFTPAGAVGNTLSTTIQTIENFNTKGKRTGHSVITTHSEKGIDTRPH